MNPVVGSEAVCKPKPIDGKGGQFPTRKNLAMPWHMVFYIKKIFLISWLSMYRRKWNI